MMLDDDSQKMERPTFQSLAVMCMSATAPKSLALETLPRSMYDQRTKKKMVGSTRKSTLRLERSVLVRSSATTVSLTHSELAQSFALEDLFELAVLLVLGGLLDLEDFDGGIGLEAREDLLVVLWCVGHVDSARCAAESGRGLAEYRE